MPTKQARYLHHNVVVSGAITEDPKIFQKKAGGILCSGFSLKVHTGQGKATIWLPCVIFNEDLAVYFAETFKKDDEIQVLKGALMRDSRPGAKRPYNAVSLVIWDIDDPAMDRSIIPEMDEGGDYIAH